MAFITEAPFRVQHSGPDITKTKLNAAIIQITREKDKRTNREKERIRYSQQMFRTEDVSLSHQNMITAFLMAFCLLSQTLFTAQRQY